MMQSCVSLPALSATTVLQQHNIEQFPAVIRMAGQMGVTTINANGLEPYVADLVDSPLWTDPDSITGLAEILQEAGVAAEETGIELRMTAMRPQRAVCPQIYRPIVLADGAVVPCSVLAYPRDSHLRIDETGSVVRHAAKTPRISFGNVNERSFKDIWRGSEYTSFRQDVGSGDFPEPCKTCLMKHYVICPQPPMSLEESLATLVSPVGAATE